MLEFYQNIYQGVVYMKTQFEEKIKKNSGIAIASGVLVLLMGIAAMVSPLAAGISIVAVIGFVLLLGGLGQLSFAFSTGKGAHSIIGGVLAVIVGGYMLMNSDNALALMTTILAAYLVISGIVELFMSFKISSVKGWGWVLFSGIVSIVLGGMIFGQFPFSGAWAVGLLVGAKLFIDGLALMMLGFSARKVSKTLS